MKTSPLYLATLCLTLCLSTAVSAAQFNTLLFTKTVGWHHESIHDAVTAMRKLAERHDFTLQWHEDAGRFSLSIVLRLSLAR